MAQETELTRSHVHARTHTWAKALPDARRAGGSADGEGQDSVQCWGVKGPEQTAEQAQKRQWTHSGGWSVSWGQRSPQQVGTGSNVHGTGGNQAKQSKKGADR